MTNIIYETTNLINGKRYIGVCTHSNENYLGSGKLLKYAIRKYGRENFLRKTLSTHDTANEAYIVENQTIEEKNAIASDDYYNLARGGYGGNSKDIQEYWDQFTKEERKELRNWNTDHSNHRPMTDDERVKRSETSSRTVQEVWDNRDNSERELIGHKISKTRKKLGSGQGRKNSMYGRSAITEQKLRWYTNGIETKYLPEETQPPGYWRGRTNSSRKIGKVKCAQKKY